MPLLDFAPEHKTEQRTDFPRLKLDAGERARVLVIDERPTYAYVHTLRAPKIVNGRAEKKTMERKDGSKYEDYVRDFIGRPLCFGDLGVLADKGVDARNCPACARATETSEVDAPQRRFALHVVKYQVKTNSHELRAPFGCELQIWSFTDQIYNKLVDIRAEWGDLRTHDLLLGPCTHKDFQKFEIMVAASAAWQSDDRIKQIVLETYRENRQADLEQFCGRKVERSWMEEDLGRIAQRWAIANGTSFSPDGTETTGAGSLTDGLAELAAAPATPPAVTADSVDLGGILDAKPASAPPAAQQPAKGGVDFSDLLTDTPPPAPTQTPSTPAASGGAAMDFDQLLNSLG